MLVVYTKPKSKKSIFGHLIRYFTKEKHQRLAEVPSHVQYVFNENFSIEAVGSGVRLGYLPTSLKFNDVIAIFEYKTEKSDLDLLNKAAEMYHNKKYDFSSIVWFSIHLLKKKLFGIPMPKKNQWNQEHHYFCSELMEFVHEEDFSTIDPNSQMLMLFKNPDKFKIVKVMQGETNV